MPIRHANPEFDPLAVDTRGLRAPGAFGAIAGEAFDTSPGPLALRWFGRQIVDPALDALGAPKGEIDQTIDADEANALYGIEGELSFDRPIRKRHAIELSAIKRRELIRRSIAERSNTNMATTLGFSFAGSIADPLNVALSFVPAGWIAKGGIAARGASAGGRAATRVGLGAAEGFLGGVAAEAIALPLARAEGRDYDFGDSLSAVFWSVMLGSVLTPALGFAFDRFSPAGRQIHGEAMAEAIDAVATGRRSEIERPIEIARAEAARRVERAAGEPIAAREIRDDVAIAPSGREAAVRYAIVEADDLIVSHTDELAVNPLFPAELQPRDRSRKASAAQIAEIVANFNPRLLDDSPDINGGAPMVARDGVVESGNGRSLALRRIYAQHPDKAARYREFLAARGYPIDGFEKPVLVRVRTEEMSGLDRIDFVRETAARREADLSAAEQGALDARRLDPNVLELLDGENVGAAQNAAFAREFARSVGNANELGRLIDAEGRLSADGAERLKAALVAYAYEEPRFVASLLEAPADDLRSIAGALIEASPAWARMKAAANAGAMDPRADITGNLIAAAELMRRARRDGIPVKALLGQGDMLGTIEPQTLAMLRVMYADDDFTRARSARNIARELQFYAEEARKTQPGPGLFGEEGDPAGRILAAIANGQDKRRSFARNFGGDDDPARLIDAPAGGRGLLQKAGGEEGITPPKQTAGGGGDTAALASVRNEAGETLPDLLERGADAAELQAHPAIRQAMAKADAIPDTSKREGFWSPEDRANRRYNFGGEEVVGVEAAAFRLADDAKVLAWVDEGLEPPPNAIRYEGRAAILIGPPAAGKSTSANSLARKFAAAIVDGDEAKKVIPEYQGGIGANAVHKESSRLISAARAILMDERANIVWPKIGDDPAQIRGLIADLKAAGYKVNLIDVSVTADESLRRMIGRFLRTGRLIPPEFMAKVGELPGKTYDLLKKEAIADGYARIDANGPAPKAIDGHELVGDALETVSRFDGDRNGGGSGTPHLDEDAGRQGFHGKNEGASQGSPSGKTRLGPESQKILDQIETDSAAIEAELKAALDEGRITQEEFDAAVAVGAPAEDIASAYDAAAFCLSRTL